MGSRFASLRVRGRARGRGQLPEGDCGCFSVLWPARRGDQGTGSAPGWYVCGGRPCADEAKPLKGERRCWVQCSVDSSCCPEGGRAGKQRCGASQEWYGAVNWRAAARESGCGEVPCVEGK